jgi:hypothetical protein
VALIALGTALALGGLAGIAGEVHGLVGLVAAAAAGPALGWVLRRTLPSAHVRNTPLACALGAGAGVAATWAAGVAWLYQGTSAIGEEDALLCLAPDCLAWALPRLTPEGAVADLWVVPATRPWLWAAIALLLLVPALYGAWCGVRARVFCEGCCQPADDTLRLHCQAIDEPAVFRGGLEAEHYGVLLQLYPGDPGDARHSRLTLEDCSGCAAYSYLTVETVAPGPLGPRATVVVRRLALWRDVFEDLERRVVGEWSQGHAELVDR